MHKNKDGILVWNGSDDRRSLRAQLAEMTAERDGYREAYLHLLKGLDRLTVESRNKIKDTFKVKVIG